MAQAKNAPQFEAAAYYSLVKSGVRIYTRMLSGGVDTRGDGSGHRADQGALKCEGQLVYYNSSIYSPIMAHRKSARPHQGNMIKATTCRRWSTLISRADLCDVHCPAPITPPG